MGFWNRFTKRKTWETTSVSQAIEVIADVVAASVEQDVVLDDVETGKTYVQNDKGVWVVDAAASDQSSFSILTWQGATKGIEIANAGKTIRPNDSFVAGTWANQVYSAESYFGDVVLTFKMSEMDTGSNNAMIGLNSDPATDTDYSSIDYAWYINDGTMRIYESGTDRGAFGSFNVHSLYAIVRRGTDIVYLQDGVELRVSSGVTSSNINLYVDTSFHSKVEIREITFEQAQANSFSVGSLQSIKTYTSSSTWTKPSWCSKIRVKVQAGGGGGSGYSESGGAGGYSEKLIDNPSSSVSVTVGGGGGNTSYYNASGNGGSSSFGSYCSAGGGQGANRYWSHSGGLGGSGSGGDLNVTGGSGASHSNPGQNVGGKSYFGTGGLASHSSYGHTSGHAAFGAGGASGYNNHYGTYGAPGVVIVEEYR